METVQKVDLRSIWPNEATDFTPWLASEDGIRRLSEAVGVRITDPSIEASVGPFNADIVGYVDGDEEKLVVVENQLEDSDHVHLGQLLTYAATARARVAIWIAAGFAPEHRRVLDWLNETSRTKYYAVQVSLLKIGGGGPAPHFQLLTHPHVELKTPARPWQIDGKKWHHNGDYRENEPIIDSVDSQLSKRGFNPIWDQKLYVKFMGKKRGRELRVYARPAHGRVDPVFMGADLEEVRSLLSGIPVTVEEHGIEEYPFVSLRAPLPDDLAERIGSWLGGK